MRIDLSKGIRNKLADRRGVSVIIVAIVLVVLVSFMALAVDVGWHKVASNHLQNIADAAALAGARELGEQYCTCCGTNGANACEQTPPPGCNFTTNCAYAKIDQAKIRAVAQDVALKNPAAEDPDFELPSEHVKIGCADPSGPYDFDHVDSAKCNGGSGPPTMVAVRARRIKSDNNPIGTLLARVMGIDSMNASKDATARLSGPDEQCINAPFGVSKAKFEQSCPGGYVVFNPTNNSCTGWSTLSDSDQVNAPNMRALLYKIACLPNWCEDMLLLDTPNFGGGTISNLLVNSDTDPLICLEPKPLNKIDLEDVYNVKKNLTTNIWKVDLPIYDWGVDECSEDGTCSCFNPTGAIKIVGFATARIRGVTTSGIEADIDCVVRPGRGEGSNVGTLSRIPSLVE